MASTGVKTAFDDDVVQAVDVVLKGPGGARLLRLAEPSDVQAAVALLRQLRERDNEAATAAPACEEPVAADTCEPSSAH